MNSIKIQINHQAIITKEELALVLYNEIGEEYDLSEEDVEALFSIENILLLPNDTFTTNFKIELPEIELRDIEPQEIIFSYLNNLESGENILSIVKTNDSILQDVSLKYYKEVIELEMEMRNVLTYILAYDTKNIENQLFSDFGINNSEKIDFEKVKEKYENGLFYIYFNHYANFTEPQKLKANQIVELLQNPSIMTFDDFKEKINNRAINETRHTDFLLSIKTKLLPLEKMRNAIMHIRNLSKKTIDNYQKAVEDTDIEKGVRSLINDFWIIEQNVLNESTWLALAKSQLERLITITQDESENIIYKMNDNYYEYEFEEEYSDLDDFKSDLIDYLKDKIVLPDFDPDDDNFEDKIIQMINFNYSVDR
ncbi:MAG: hypothetical protein KAS53_09525 [Candidatus Cloacimonetes bacterium]|nr:hypothetical protein [Candidatus Cloacimonadota bacterium]